MTEPREEPTLESLMRHGIRIMADIDLTEQQVAAWNASHPEEAPLEWDPGGTMRKIRDAVGQTVEELRRRINVERLTRPATDEGAR